jgi:hypothetical protein
VVEIWNSQTISRPASHHVTSSVAVLFSFVGSQNASFLDLPFAKKLGLAKQRRQELPERHFKLMPLFSAW